VISNHESTQIAGKNPPLIPPGRGTEKTALVLSFLEIALIIDVSLTSKVVAMVVAT
jgi:hypothetical protein